MGLLLRGLLGVRRVLLLRHSAWVCKIPSEGRAASGVAECCQDVRTYTQSSSLPPRQRSFARRREGLNEGGCTRHV